jgi:hypothetical protein
MQRYPELCSEQLCHPNDATEYSIFLIELRMRIDKKT